MKTKMRAALVALLLWLCAPAQAQTHLDASGTVIPGIYDTQSAPFLGASPMTPGTTYSAQRSVGVLATAAGNVQFQLLDTSTLTLPVYVGWQTFPFACTQIVPSGTSATATYYNLK